LENTLAKRFLKLKEACEWASSYIGRRVTPSNISYLIQYAKIRAYDEEGNPKSGLNGQTKISLQELKEYYDRSWKKERWKQILGEDINWNLSFDNFREAERTKHVHRLHPYKGKFIPQLVEYFLDSHTNDFKKNVFFREGDIILDPFVGSGTTLIQCLELGLHSIGIDISKFNCVMSEVKVQRYDLDKLSSELRAAAKTTEEFSNARFWYENETEIDEVLSYFNKKYYPNPEFKFLLGVIREFEDRIEGKINKSCQSNQESRQEITEDVLDQHKDEIAALEKEIADFLGRNSIPLQFRVTTDNCTRLEDELTNVYGKVALQEFNKRIPRQKQTSLSDASMKPFASSPFVSRWFTERQREEMQHYINQIRCQADPKIQQVMKIILSRTARSCRATTHIDLATLIKPQTEPYYCRKHFKICRPVTTIIYYLKRYTKDTIHRIKEFDLLRKDAFCEVINADSRTIDLLDYLARKNPGFYKILEKKKIDGIFTSPPYVGQIDYHEQHAYAYELFNIERKDDLEIGKQSNGTSKRAQNDYVASISSVLLNIKKYLKKDAHIFIVANDRRNLYPTIAKASGLKIIEVFRRPVLNRTERDKQPYSESIFHMTFE
jgi:hypothetical protein